MGVVHQKGDAMAVADLRQTGDVQHAAQIVGRGDVYRHGRRGLLVQRPVQTGRREGTGAQGTLSLWAEPAGLQVQEGAAVEKGFVGVPSGQHGPGGMGRAVEEGQVEHGLHTLGGAPGAVKGVAGTEEGGGVVLASGQHGPGGMGRAVEEGQVEHGLHTLGGAPGAVKGVAGTEEGGGVVLAFQDDPLRVGEVVGAGHLGDVQVLAAQGAPALVAGHVEPGGAGGGIAAHKVTDGGIHA